MQTSSEVVSHGYFIDLSAYPQWLVVLVGTLLAAIAIWILIKVLKFAMWVLLFCVVIGGILWAGSLFLGHGL